MRPPDNPEIADTLERVADLLETQDANSYRVSAYRGAARTLRSISTPAARILADEGTAGLVRLPGVGKSIAALIAELLQTGSLRLLERLEGQVSPEDLFTTLPGVGEELAARIHRELGVETLEALELAAHDGRLETVPGIGPRRLRQVRDGVAAVLTRSGRRRARRYQPAHAPPSGATTDARAAEATGDAQPALPTLAPEPPVAPLLDVDHEYRRRAEAGELRTIAPRRFNPRGESWLPILHVDRDGWSFTALYSNTARAHELGRTLDWVMIYFERNGDEGQVTVVTESRGPLAGRRVVRGHEHACARVYERTPDAGSLAPGA